jgi:Flp pilus assembly protein CpaB
MDQRRRARLFLILGVLLSLGAAAATFFIAQGSQTASAPPPPPTVDILVAAREIPARTLLQPADVKVAKLNADAAPPDPALRALTASYIKDPKEALTGKVLIQPVSIGEPIFPAKFAAAERAFTVFPAGEAVAPGAPSYRIMTISVPDTFAVGGILVAGDSVDVMYVFQFDPCAKLQIGTSGVQGCLPAGGVTAPGTPVSGPVTGTTGATPVASTKYTQDSVAKIILGPMQLLARAGSTYTIRVDAALAERLAYIQAAGGILQFLLRAPGDDRAAATTGATFGSVFTQFKFPLPEKIQVQP